MASKGIKIYKKKKDEDELLTKLHTAETACVSHELLNLIVWLVLRCVFLYPLQHVVKYLKRGIWPEQLNREGDAPLHYYIKRRDKHRFDCLMAFLIHSTSIIDLVNNDGMTALHLSCEVSCRCYETTSCVCITCDLDLVGNTWYNPLLDVIIIPNCALRRHVCVMLTQ